MAWFDVAMIMFVCVAINHLGLIHAIEEIAETKFRIVNCPKCLSCWTVMLYMVLTHHDIIVSVATSFLCAALAPWLNLLMGFFDTKFNWLYDKIYSTAEDEPSEANASEDNSTVSVS